MRARFLALLYRNWLFISHHNSFIPERSRQKSTITISTIQGLVFLCEKPFSRPTATHTPTTIHYFGAWTIHRTQSLLDQDVTRDWMASSVNRIDLVDHDAVEQSCLFPQLVRFVLLVVEQRRSVTIHVDADRSSCRQGGRSRVLSAPV